MQDNRQVTSDRDIHHHIGWPAGQVAGWPAR